MKRKSIKPTNQMRAAAVVAAAGSFHQPFWNEVARQVNDAYGADEEGNVKHEPGVKARKTK